MVSVDPGKIKGTFYEARPARETLGAYLRSQDSLYDRVKNQQIERLLEKEAAGCKHVLEVGCGGGVWTKYFVSRGASVTIIEKEPHLIEAARFYLLCQGLSTSHIDFRCGDASSVILARKFDLVFLKDVIEHIREDGQFFHHMASNLTARGLIFISTQNSLSLNYLVEGAYQRYIRGHRAWMGWDPTHVRFYNYLTIKRLLRREELQPVKWLGTYYIPYRFLKLIGPTILEIAELRAGRLLHILESTVGDRFPINIFGWNIAVLAKKVT